MCSHQLLCDVNLRVVRTLYRHVKQLNEKKNALTQKLRSSKHMDVTIATNTPATHRKCITWSICRLCPLTSSISYILATLTSSLVKKSSDKASAIVCSLLLNHRKQAAPETSKAFPANHNV